MYSFFKNIGSLSFIEKNIPINPYNVSIQRKHCARSFGDEYDMVLPMVSLSLSTRGDQAGSQRAIAGQEMRTA